MIQSCVILDDNVLKLSRHTPIHCEISVAVNGWVNENRSQNSHSQWKKLSSEEFQEYCSRLDDALKDVDYIDIPMLTTVLSFGMIIS